MNLSLELDTRIDRARAWLSTMTEDGAFRRNYDTVTEEKGPVSSEITGYGAHLFSWLFAVYLKDEDRRTARQAADWLASAWEDCGVLTVEPGQDLLYFFDMGIAGRGLFAASIALDRKDFWDVAIQIGTQMKAFERAPGLYDAVRRKDGEPREDGGDPWWSRNPGPYQRKAALLWKLVRRIGDHDDLDLKWIKAGIPAGAKKGDALDIQLKAADQLHPWAYNCEALLVSEAANGRATRAIQGLQSRLGNWDITRCDVLAQLLRMLLVKGTSPAMTMLDQLFELQHKDGGFHFRIARGKLSPDLSVHATLFAIQAMAMAQDPKRATLPGLLRRRELAIL